MKKLRYFLSLLSLLLVGVYSAQAQKTYPEWSLSYEPGVDPVTVTDMKLDGTTPYVLKGISSNGHAPADRPYLADADYTAGVTAVYVFVPTNETDVNGNATYYLQNKITGKYLRYEEFEADDTSEDQPSDAGGKYVFWTADQSQAAKLAVLQAQGDDKTATRSYCTPRTVDGQTVNTWNETSITMTYDQEYGNSTRVVAFGCFQAPFISIYTDTKAWDVFSVTIGKANESLAALMLRIGATQGAYTAGTTIGTYPQAVVDAYNAAYTAANALAEKESSTEAECKAAYEALVKAMTAADAALIMPTTDKWYYIKSLRPGYAYSNSTNMLVNHEFVEPTAETFVDNPDAAKFWWKIAKAEDGTTYTFQNYYDSKYVGVATAGGAEIAYPMGDTPADSYVLSAGTGSEDGPTFTILSKKNGNQMHDAASDKIVSWTDLAAAGGNFRFIEVPQSVIDASAAAIEQLRINEKVNALLPTAQAFLQRNITYTLGVEATDLTQTTGNVLTSDSQLSTNALEPTEGSLAGLVDTDIESYFHTAWSVANTTDGRVHALTIDLGQALKDFTIRAAMRNNNGMNDLKSFNLFTSNDGKTWKKAGEYTFNYKYSCANPEGFKDWNNWPKSTKNTAVLGVTLPEAVKYLRLEKVSDIGNTTTAWWYLSTLQIFSGATADTNPANSPIYNSSVPAAARDGIINAVAAAVAQSGGLNIADNGTITETADKYTQAVYDQLYKAYNEALKYVPDVATLNAQLDSIGRAASSMKVGDAIGFFPQDKKTAFETSFAAIKGQVSETMDIEEINSVRTQALTALNTLKSSFRMPTQGKVYIIRCGADYAGGQSVKNNVAYSDSNDPTTWIRERRDSITTIVGTDTTTTQFDSRTDLRSLWLAEKVDGHNITLRNLGTGMYIGAPDTVENNQYIPNSIEPVEHELVFSGRAGVLNMPVGDGFFVNFHGGGAGYGLVVWEANTSLGDSITGSTVKFEEVSEGGDFNSVNWNLANRSVGSYQILTLPFSGKMGGRGSVTYSVLGQRQDGENYTLELKKNTAGTFKAGVPFVYKTNANDSTLNQLSILTENEAGLSGAIKELSSFVREGSQQSDALVGLLANDTLRNVQAGTAYFRGSEVRAITGEQSRVGYAVYANAGYILPTVTEEIGDEHIPLRAELSTGIAETVVDANSKVDVYTISGVKVRQSVKAASATNGLPAGIYIVGGKKVLVK